MVRIVRECVLDWTRLIVRAGMGKNMYESNLELTVEQAVPENNSSSVRHEKLNGYHLHTTEQVHSW